MKESNQSIVITKLKKHFNLNDEKATLVVGIFFIIIFGIMAAFFQSQSESPQLQTQQPQESIDVLIPPEQSLVPINITNYESLDQLIGQFGVVDVYSTPLNPLAEPPLIASRVKLVRSPKNPRYFSVLVPADKAKKFARIMGEVTVVVRNPKLIGTQFDKKKRRQPKRRVVYESED